MQRTLTTPPKNLFTPSKKREETGNSQQIENAALLALQDALEDEKLLIEGVAPPPLMPLQGTLPTTPFSIAAIQNAAIPPEMLEIFEKGVYAMAHLTTSGVSETTFFLDTPQFAGAKIIVTEFNTAPKIFNIALIGAPEMAALFHSHASDLMAAFQKSPFNFTVHRIESAIDLKKVEKKEDLSDQNEDEGKQ